MKKLSLTRHDFAVISLFVTGGFFLLTGVFLNSLWMMAGVAGLIAAWFLCIDCMIANHSMNLARLIVFGSIILFLPLFFVLYLSA